MSAAATAATAAAATVSDATNQSATDIELADADVTEGGLPQCKIKRNYSCNLCDFFSQNPRSFLYHSRDVHNDKIKVYECSQCLYASKHSQKLQRHINMIHVAGNRPRKTPVRRVAEKATRCDTADPADPDGNSFVKDEEEEYKCSVCSFTSRSDLLIRRHERLVHLKKRFFRCNKCSYVTHVKARFTKHVKYHSMPMIKCTICDFRTPYKWNLDRHYKNHSGTGTFLCSKCNFRADIKQSLTVHEMNHHVPPVGQGAVMLRRRNKVGSSEALNRDDMELLRLEREHLGLPEDDEMYEEPDINADELKPYPAEKSPSAEAVPSTSKAFNCKICNFDAGDIREVWRHERSVHNFVRIDSKLDHPRTRPPPQLIPIQAKAASPKLVECKREELVNEEEFNALCKKSSLTSSLKEFVSLIGDEEALKSIPDSNEDIEPQSKKICLGEDVKKKQTDLLKKKNASFFEKLKEKIVSQTGEENSLECEVCGHASKCLSEAIAHEKKHVEDMNVKVEENPLPEAELSSTRCQHCRQRCKTSSDLINHLKTCKAFGAAYGTHHLEEEEPQENKVFVWNDLQSFDNPETGVPSSEIKTTIRQGMKKVFKCPHCSFWASTASRFHVHIVGHLNKKPFECSLCYYRSNWRWDITKHIRLKSARDPSHLNATVNMTDETGRRNYTKYNKYLTMMKVPEIHADSSGTGRRTRSAEATQGVLSDQDVIQPIPAPPQLKRAPAPGSAALSVPEEALLKPPPLMQAAQSAGSSSKRTLWKCKKCQYRNSEKEMVLAHVKEHYEEKKKEKGKKEEVVAEESSNNSESNDASTKSNAIIACDICPFKTQNEGDLTAHKLNHVDRPGSIFKCTYCPFYVPSKIAVLEHMEIHGNEEALGRNPLSSDVLSVNDNSNSIKILPDPPAEQKRHRCKQCPYVTNSRNHFLYHKQFHRPRSAPFKCLYCSYNVTRRHLLQQHLRVHYNDSKTFSVDEDPAEIPLVWVFRGGSYLKMFKCRWCPHVNVRKLSVQEHEKVHLDGLENLNCEQCDFECQNPVQMLQHVKSDHENGEVELDKLVEPEVVIKIEEPDITPESTYYQTSTVQEENAASEDDGLKFIHFCQKCPARFLFKKELRIHAKFHLIRLPFKCDYCSYTVRQRPHLMAHTKVHGKEYQDRTSEMLQSHDVAPENPKPPLEQLGDSIWVIAAKKGDKPAKGPVKHACSLCPATFFKIVALQYHLTLHGSNQRHKCSYCTYSVKNYGNLSKHLLVHPEFLTKKEVTPVKKIYTCTKCNFSVKYHASFLDHVKRHSKTDIFPCSRCPYSTTEKDALESHQKNHGVKLGVDCPHCDFSHGSDISEHVKIHFPPDPKPKAYLTPGAFEIWCTDYDNNITTKIFFDKGEYAEGSRFPDTPELKQESKVYVNPNTGQLVPRGREEYELNEDLKLVPKEIKLKAKMKEAKWQCEKCPQKFCRKDNLLYHEKHHGAKLENTCHICDYSVRYRTKFFKHLEWHKDPKRQELVKVIS